MKMKWMALAVIVWAAGGWGAGTYDRITTGDYQWSTTTNWSPNHNPTGVGDTATWGSTSSDSLFGTTGLSRIEITGTGKKVKLAGTAHTIYANGPRANLTLGANDTVSYTGSTGFTIYGYNNANTAAWSFGAGSFFKDGSSGHSMSLVPGSNAANYTTPASSWGITLVVTKNNATALDTTTQTGNISIVGLYAHTIDIAQGSSGKYVYISKADSLIEGYGLFLGSTSFATDTFVWSPGHMTIKTPLLSWYATGVPGGSGVIQITNDTSTVIFIPSANYVYKPPAVVTHYNLECRASNGVKLIDSTKTVCANDLIVSNGIYMDTATAFRDSCLDFHSLRTSSVAGDSTFAYSIDVGRNLEANHYEKFANKTKWRLCGPANGTVWDSGANLRAVVVNKSGTLTFAGQTAAQKETDSAGTISNAATIDTQTIDTLIVVSGATRTQTAPLKVKYLQLNAGANITWTGAIIYNDCSPTLINNSGASLPAPSYGISCAPKIDSISIAWAATTVSTTGIRLRGQHLLGSGVTVKSDASTWVTSSTNDTLIVLNSPTDHAAALTWCKDSTSGGKDSVAFRFYAQTTPLTWNRSGDDSSVINPNNWSPICVPWGGSDQVFNGTSTQAAAMRSDMTTGKWLFQKAYTGVFNGSTYWLHCTGWRDSSSCLPAVRTNPNLDFISAGDTMYCRGTALGSGIQEFKKLYFGAAAQIFQGDSGDVFATQIWIKKNGSLSNVSIDHGVMNGLQVSMPDSVNPGLLVDTNATFAQGHRFHIWTASGKNPLIYQLRPGYTWNGTAISNVIEWGGPVVDGVPKIVCTGASQNWLYLTGSGSSFTMIMPDTFVTSGNFGVASQITTTTATCLWNQTKRFEAPGGLTAQSSLAGCITNRKFGPGKYVIGSYTYAGAGSWVDTFTNAQFVVNGNWKDTAQLTTVNNGYRIAFAGNGPDTLRSWTQVLDTVIDSMAAGQTLFFSDSGNCNVINVKSGKLAAHKLRTNTLLKNGANFTQSQTGPGRVSGFKIVGWFTASGNTAKIGDSTIALTRVSADSAYGTVPTMSAGAKAIVMANSSVDSIYVAQGDTVVAAPILAFRTSPLSATVGVAITPDTCLSTGGATDSVVFRHGLAVGGLSYSKATGIISGTPTTAQTVTDTLDGFQFGASAGTATISITVASGCAPASVTYAAATDTTYGGPYTHTPANSGAAFDSAWVKPGDSLRAYLSINHTTGVISGSTRGAAAATTVRVVFRATQGGNSCYDTASFALTIVANPRITSSTSSGDTSGNKPVAITGFGLGASGTVIRASASDTMHVTAQTDSTMAATSNAHHAAGAVTYWAVKTTGDSVSLSYTYTVPSSGGSHRRHGFGLGVGFSDAWKSSYR